MKKSIKAKLRRKSKQPEAPVRITNDTVAEHRERIIAGGRRYKYPIQYAKHKIIINTVIISAAAIVLLTVFGWWQLYIVKNSSTVFYRVTQLLPLPVADVDGERAQFSDYLLNFRASEYYLSKYDDLSIDSESGRLQLQYKQRDALNLSIEDAYARKIAKSDNLQVSDKEVDKALGDLRNAANGQLTQQTSEASSQSILGMSPGDLRTSIYNSILRSKAAFAVDSNARATRDAAEKLLQTQTDFTQVATALNTQRADSAVAGSSGDVSISTIFSGIRASDVARLPVGKVSGPLMSVTTDGYFFVNVTKKDDATVSFTFLKLPLSQFDAQLDQLRSDNKIHEYISVPVEPTTK